MAIRWVAPGGSNSNSGTGRAPSLAWGTIQYGVDNILPGDTLIVAEGVYFETVLIASPGTAAQKKAIQFSGVAHIDGLHTSPGGAFVAGSDSAANTQTHGTQTGLGYVDDALIVCTASHWTISAEVRNSRGHGVELRYAGTPITNVTVSVEAINCRASGIKFSGNPASVSDISNILLLIQGADGVTGCGNFFPYPRDAADMPWLPAVDVQHVSNLNILPSTISQNWGEGLSLIGQNINALSQLTVYDNWSANVKITRSQSVNISAMVNWHSNDPTFMKNGSTGGHGVLFDMDGPGTLTTQDVFIFNSLIVGSLDSAFHFGGSTTISNLIQIYSNTLYGTFASGVLSMDGAFDTSYSQVRFRNNSATAINGVADTIAGNPANIDSDYNGWYNGTPSPSVAGANDVDGDPSLASPVHDIAITQAFDIENYRILPTSILVGQADPAFLPAQDITAVDRDAVPDIGAFDATGTQAPVLASIPAQSSRTGLFTSYTLTATEPQGETITWTVTGLPPGLTFNAGTQVISGIPTDPGTYSVLVRAEDPSGLFDDESIAWTVTGAAIDQNVYFSATTVSGLTVQFTTINPDGFKTYDINFGDGSSASNGPNFTHTYAAAGVYNVIYSITLSSGVTLTRRRIIHVGGNTTTYQS